MQQHELEQLLKRTADADKVGGDTSHTPEFIANRARVLVRRHKRIRAAACANTGLILLLVLIGISRNSENPGNDPQPKIATNEQRPKPKTEMDYRQEIRRLREEADRQMRIVKAMQNTAPNRLAPVSPPSTATRVRLTPVKLPVSIIIEQETEVTARIMVEQAARWMNQPDLRDKGIRSYRRTVELFPTTVAGRIAKNRLREIDNQSGVSI